MRQMSANLARVNRQLAEVVSEMASQRDELGQLREAVAAGGGDPFLAQPLPPTAGPRFVGQGKPARYVRTFSISGRPERIPVQTGPVQCTKAEKRSGSMLLPKDRSEPDLCSLLSRGQTRGGIFAIKTTVAFKEVLEANTCTVRIKHRK